MNNSTPEEQEQFSPLLIKEREKRRLWEDILDPGAKLLFCFLIDNSWLFQYGGGTPGTICISVSQISRRLRVGPRSVSRWTKLLAQRGYLWISRRSFTNCKPVNVYHLSCLCPPDPNAVQTWFSSGGMWGHQDEPDTPATMAVGSETPENDVPDESDKGEFEETGQNGSSELPERPRSAANLAGDSCHNGHGPVPPWPRAGATVATARSHNGHGQVPPRPRAGANLAGDRSHNGHGQLPKSDVIRRLQTRRNGESIEEGRGSPHKTATRKAFKLPKFAPIPADIFPSKLERMLSDCEREVKRIQADPAFKVPAAGPDIPGMLAQADHLEKQGGERSKAEAKSLRDRAETLAARQSQGAKDQTLSDDGKSLIRLYRDRIKEIRSRMNGVEVTA